MPQTSGPPWEDEYVEFVRARLPALRRLAMLLCGDEHRGDDLVQQAITQLYVSWERARTATDLAAYARTTLVRVFVDERRRGWARVRLFGAAPEPAPVASGEAAATERLVVRAALARLPRRQQAVLVLRYLDDRPVDEVATILGCTPGTVKSHSARGLAAMRRQLDRTPSRVEGPTVEGRQS